MINVISNRMTTNLKREFRFLVDQHLMRTAVIEYHVDLIPIVMTMVWLGFVVQQNEMILTAQPVDSNLRQKVMLST